MEIVKRSEHFEIGKNKIPRERTRTLTLELAEVTADKTLTLSVSSDLPYERWFYIEVLDHSPDAVDLSRFNDGAMVLFNHNRDDYVGVIERAWLSSGKLYNQIRFDTHELAERIQASVNAGIIRNVSIGYMVDELVLEKENKDGLSTYRATKWTPFETSLVTVPADASVGVGRSQGRRQEAEGRREDEVNFSIEEKSMEKETTVTLEVNEIDIKKAERDRIRSIMAAGKKYDCVELAQRAIDEDMSLEQARSLFLDHVRGQQKPVATTVDPVGMNDRERRRYSFNRAIGYAAGLIPASECGLELEVSRALEKKIGKPPKGRIYVDQSELVSYRAPYETGNPAAAGNLISTDLLSGRFIEQLYNRSAFLPMGVTYLRDLEGNIEIPREATYQNAYWIGEGQVITEDEGTFDKIALSPKKIAVITRMTYEMTVQSSIDLEQLTRNRILRAIALEIDRTIGFGSGIGEEPLGIISHPEVRSIELGTNGGEFNWDTAIDMIAELDSINAISDGVTFGFIVNSRTKAKLQKTLDHDTGAGNWIWQPGTNPVEGAIAGYRARCSNQIPNNLVKGTATNLTAAFFGDFSNVLMGIWSGLDLMANPYSQFDQAIISIRAMQMLDLNLTRGDYFCCATDIQNN